MATTGRDSGDPAAPSPMLTVAAVARRLGVAPSTLRTWDRRYDLGPSAHTAGSHRRYGPRGSGPARRHAPAHPRGRAPRRGRPHRPGRAAGRPGSAARPRSRVPRCRDRHATVAGPLLAAPRPRTPPAPPPPRPPGVATTGPAAEDPGRERPGDDRGDSRDDGDEADDGHHRAGAPGRSCAVRGHSGPPRGRRALAAARHPRRTQPHGRPGPGPVAQGLDGARGHPRVVAAPVGPGGKPRHPRNGGGRVVALPDGSPAARGLARAAMSLGQP